MFGQSNNSEMALPQFNASVPVNVYVNGKQVPPIETEGKITKFNLSGLQILCSQKIPIPAAGVLRFEFGDQSDEVELNVEFLQRVDVTKRGWFWKSKPRYEFKAVFGKNPRDRIEQLQRQFHRMLFGGNMVGVKTLNYTPAESEF